MRCWRISPKPASRDLDRLLLNAIEQALDGIDTDADSTKSHAGVCLAHHRHPRRRCTSSAPPGPSGSASARKCRAPRSKAVCRAHRRHRHRLRQAPGPAQRYPLLRRAGLRDCRRQPQRLPAAENAERPDRFCRPGTAPVPVAGSPQRARHPARGTAAADGGRIPGHQPDPARPVPEAVATGRRR